MWLSVFLLLSSASARATDCQSLTETPVVATFSDVAIGQNVYSVRRGLWKDLREELIECGAYEPARHLRLWIVERNASAWFLLGGQYTAPATIGFAISSRVERNKFRSTLASWDSDNDAIEPDQCSDTPEDADGFEDADGCPEVDNDQDGLVDAEDECPDVFEDEDNFEDVDGCPDPDNDKDSILDGDDQCPNEREDFDGFEDQNGCPDPDNDGDSVLDMYDACPIDPGPANTVGCPDRGDDFDDVDLDALAPNNDDGYLDNDHSSRSYLSNNFRGVEFGPAAVLAKKPMSNCRSRPEDGIRWTCVSTIAEQTVKIHYMEQHNLFFGVFIQASGYSECEWIKRTLDAAWGEPSQPNEYIEDFYWHRGAIYAIYSLNSITDSCQVLQLNNDLQQQVEELNRTSAAQSVDDL